MRSTDYKLGVRLGEGAYGVVYSVTHIPSNSNYALKRILMKTNDDGIPQSVLREIASLVSIKSLGHHPNIIKIHDAFVAKTNQNTFLNIIFEKCDWDLQEFLREIPSDMPDGQCKHFAKQFFSGIDFLHSNSIIHRDLKPQNILVNRNQSLKIADFGLARNYGLNSTLTTLVVTLNYRCPELLLQCKYSTSVDIWSAGCILLELYSRRPLFVAQTEAEQLYAIFQNLGTPSLEIWPSEAVIEHSFYPLLPGSSLHALVPKASEMAIDLAKNILNFNPHRRPTASECLQHPYFL